MSASQITAAAVGFAIGLVVINLAAWPFGWHFGWYR